MNLITLAVFSLVISNLGCFFLLVRHYINRDQREGYYVTFIISVLTLMGVIITLCNTTGWR